MSVSALVMALCCLSGGPSFSGRLRSPDIFLIIIDTLRADHLGCYGYSRGTSPALDSLAVSGTVFTNCQAQAPWTLPAHGSIWTGLTVRSHRAGMRHGTFYGLDPGLETIATMMKKRNYVTMGFVNTHLISGDFGFDLGFDHYSWTGTGHGRAGETVDEVLGWYNENYGNLIPKLVVIHLYDVHAPYDPPEPFDTRFSPQGTTGITEWRVDSLGRLENPGDRQHLIDMYDGEISWVDSQLDRLFRFMRKTGIDERAVVIVTSDHGEEFLEHGRWGHGHSLFQEQLHVPLIISGPFVQAGVRDPVPCGQIDILPVIAGLTGAQVPEGVQGHDILSSSPGRRGIPSSGTFCNRYFHSDDALIESQASLLSYPLKLIINFHSGQEWGYHLGNDPGEQQSVPPDSSMVRELDHYWSTPPLAEPPAVGDDGSFHDDLHDLGYI